MEHPVLCSQAEEERTTAVEIIVPGPLSVPVDFSKDQIGIFYFKFMLAYFAYNTQAIII